MLAYEGDPEYAERSATRYNRAAELLASAPAGIITMETLHGFLQDHENAPDSLCRHEAQDHGGHRVLVCGRRHHRTIWFGRGSLSLRGEGAQVLRLTLSRLLRAAARRSRGRSRARPASAASSPRRWSPQVGAGIQQQLDALEVAVGGRRVQRRVPVTLSVVRIGACVEQQPHDGRVPSRRTRMQRGPRHPSGAVAIHQRAPSQEEPHGVRLPEERREVQRREAVAADGVDELGDPRRGAPSTGRDRRTSPPRTRSAGQRAHARRRPCHCPSGSARVGRATPPRRRARPRATAARSAAPAPHRCRRCRSGRRDRPRCLPSRHLLTRFCTCLG